MKNDFSNVIPKGLDYFSMIEKLAGVNKRTESYIYPETGSNAYSPQNNIIRFRFNTGMLDFRDSMWEFNATCSATGGTYCRFSQGIGCLVQRLVLKIGSNTMIDTVNFNLLYSMFNLSQDPAYLTTTAAFLEGYTSQATRNADATNTARYYNLKLGNICELLNIVWPADFISEQVTVEIYLENPNRCLESDGTNPTYVVNFNQYHYGVFECTSEYYELLRGKIASEGVMIPYKAYENFVSTLPINSTNIQTVLPFKRQCLLSVLYVARNNANVSNPAINDKFETFLNNAVFNSARIKINDQYYPNDKVQNIYEAYLQNLEVWDKELLEPVQYGNDWVDYFIVSQSVTQNPRHLEMNDVISGIDTSLATSTITAEIILNSPGAPVLEEVQYYGNFYGLMYIRPDRSITFQQ